MKNTDVVLGADMGKFIPQSSNVSPMMSPLNQTPVLSDA